MNPREVAPNTPLGLPVWRPVTALLLKGRSRVHPGEIAPNLFSGLPGWRLAPLCCSRAALRGCIRGKSFQVRPRACQGGVWRRCVAERGAPGVHPREILRNTPLGLPEWRLVPLCCLRVLSGGASARNRSKYALGPAQVEAGAAVMLEGMLWGCICGESLQIRPWACQRGGWCRFAA